MSETQKKTNVIKSIRKWCKEKLTGLLIVEDTTNFKSEAVTEFIRMSFRHLPVESKFYPHGSSGKDELTRLFIVQFNIFVDRKYLATTKQDRCEEISDTIKRAFVHLSCIPFYSFAGTTPSELTYGILVRKTYLDEYVAIEYEEQQRDPKRQYAIAFLCSYNEVNT